MDWHKIQQYLAQTTSILIVLIGFVLFTRLFIVNPGRVNGVSMEPTFRDGNVFFVNRFIYLFKQPERFDLIDLINPEDPTKFFIKRVIGLPGETVTIKEGFVYITGVDGVVTKLDEPYLAQAIYTQLTLDQRAIVYVPEDSYFVMGDNRPFSHDSRDMGPVHRGYINGKLFGTTDSL